MAKSESGTSLAEAEKKLKDCTVTLKAANTALKKAKDAQVRAQAEHDTSRLTFDKIVSATMESTRVERI